MPFRLQTDVSFGTEKCIKTWNDRSRYDGGEEHITLAKTASFHKIDERPTFEGLVKGGYEQAGSLNTYPEAWVRVACSSVYIYRPSWW